MNLKCLNYLNLELKNQTVYLQSDQDEKILENKTLENHKLLKLNFHKLIVFFLLCLISDASICHGGQLLFFTTSKYSLINGSYIIFMI